MAIEFSAEERSDLVPSIQRYMAEKLDVELGNLDAEFLLGFFAQEIGPRIYNKAVRDAQALLQERVVELDAVCFEVEQSWWQKEGARRGS